MAYSRATRVLHTSLFTVIKHASFNVNREMYARQWIECLLVALNTTPAHTQTGTNAYFEAPIDFLISLQTL